jgi:hypothetical protein
MQRQEEPETSDARIVHLKADFSSAFPSTFIASKLAVLFDPIENADRFQANMMKSLKSRSSFWLSFIWSF